MEKRIILCVVHGQILKTLQRSVEYPPFWFLNYQYQQKWTYIVTLISIWHVLWILKIVTFAMNTKKPIFQRIQVEALFLVIMLMIKFIVFVHSSNFHRKAIIIVLIISSMLCLMLWSNNNLYSANHAPAPTRILTSPAGTRHTHCMLSDSHIFFDVSFCIPSIHQQSMQI